MSTRDIKVSVRNRLTRLPDRGSYDRETLYEVLDAGRICHVAWADGSRPMCLPTAYGRWEDDLILHGAAKGRFLEAMAGGAELCISVTLLDGLVLARSTFHSSMNYRSVVIFGRGEKIVDSADKVKALDLLVDHLAPGRALEVRPTTEPELEATAVIRVPIVEASAKIRTGPPGDAKADLDLPIWAGVVPIVPEIGQPVAAPGSEELEVPPSVRSFRWS